METLDVDGSFDVHEYRHGLKLLKDDRETMLLENRDGFRCPCCNDPFERLFVSGKRKNTFGDPDGRFCVVRTDDQTLLLSH